MPPTFGAFARRTYASDNPLIGYPLAYQYLTSLRPDAHPGERRRAARQARPRLAGRSYSLGNPAFEQGVPLVSAFRWDTGVQAHATVGIVERDRVGDRRHALEPALHRRQPRPAARRTRRASARCAGADPRRVGRARAVRQPGGGTRARLATVTTASSRRPRGAATPSTRAATICSASRRSSAAGAADRDGAADQLALQAPLSALVDLGRGPLQDCGPDFYVAGALRSSGLQRSDRRGRDAAVGRTGHADRDRRRLLDPAQSAAEGFVPARRPRRRPAAQGRAHVRRATGVLVLGWQMTSTRTRKRTRSGTSERRRSPRASRLLLRVRCDPGVRLSPAPRRGRAPGSDPRPRRDRGAAAAPVERRPGVAELGTPAGTRSSRICCARSCIWSRRRAAPSKRASAGHAVMDQRNETFVPHVLAITTGTTVDFPEHRQHLPQRVFALEDQAVRSRPLRGRQLAVPSASIAPASSASSATSTRT